MARFGLTSSSLIQVLLSKASSGSWGEYNRPKNHFLDWEKLYKLEGRFSNA